MAIPSQTIYFQLGIYICILHINIHIAIDPHPSQMASYAEIISWRHEVFVNCWQYAHVWCGMWILMQDSVGCRGTLDHIRAQISPCFKTSPYFYYCEVLLPFHEEMSTAYSASKYLYITYGIQNRKCMHCITYSIQITISQHIVQSFHLMLNTFLKSPSNRLPYSMDELLHTPQLMLVAV